MNHFISQTKHILSIVEFDTPQMVVRDTYRHKEDKVTYFQ